MAACSPAINMGNNDLDTLIDTDLGGKPRILEGIVDLGAYERNHFSIQVSNVIDVSCFQEQDGAVEFEIDGDEPVDINWVNADDQGQGAEQLASGDYLFSITDVSNCSDTLSILLSEPDSIAGDFTINHASTPTANDGSIVTDQINGGTPPYQFNWSNGDSSNNLINLSPGEYILTVTDSNDCIKVFNFEVSFISSSQEALSSNSFQLFPNPTTAEITLKWTNPGLLPNQFILYNSLGQEVLNKIISPLRSTYTIRLPKLTKGIYYWKATINGDSASGKLLIESRS